jgi:bifunctional UDP-N-acetylglucosamine pyrophosphorylase / glucosamine-1-phosphate N-acetyltransferase
MAVVLAAGMSTRMKSARSKVLHPILGREIINILIENLVSSGVAEENIVVVVGANADEVRAAVRRPVRYAVQARQLGTAHALLAARAEVADFCGDLLVTVGDNPYVTAAELRRLTEHHRSCRSSCTFISAIFDTTPPPYGRVIRDANGVVRDVIEELDATPEQLAIREVNSSIYMFDNEAAFPRLARIGNANRKKEYYLTDIIGILRDDGFRIEAVPAADFRIAIGINTRWELQQAQADFNNERLRQLALEQGVTVLQPETVTVEYGVEIGPDTTLYPNTFLGSGTRIGRNCAIGPFVYLRGAVIGDNQRLAFCSRVQAGE